MTSNIADVCSCIEMNEPPIKSLAFVFIISEQSRVMVTVEDICQRHLMLDVTDINAWGRLGRATGSNKSLKQLMVFPVNNAGDVVLPAAELFLRALHDNLKYNTTIETLRMQIVPTNEVPMLDLNIFVRNNTHLTSLFLVSHVAITPDQSLMISSALRNAQFLKKFDVMRCKFDDQSFGQIVSSCLRIETLRVTCTNLNHYISIASLLRNPHTMIKKVHVYTQSVADEGLSLISESLRSNTKLKTISFYNRSNTEINLGALGNLLCDLSTINGICNSNHSIEHIDLPNANQLPALARDCLVFNQHTNKLHTIRKKIMRYYFAGNFDVAPFMKMPISLLPRVICLIEGDVSYCQNAIMRMLRNVPDLCNVGNRDLR